MAPLRRTKGLRMRLPILLLSLSILYLPCMATFAQDKPASPGPGSPSAAGPADAESDEAKTAVLAKAAQNPIADLISFPLQNNTAFGIGPYARAQNELLIEPVIPLHITKDWNLITRTIWPQLVQPDPTQPTKGWTGFGDLNPSFFLSPSAPHKLTWGVGPTFVLPWATAEQLGQGKFSMGPAVVALTMPGHWVIGVLANNIWSVEGPHERANVNQMLLQYFVNYNFKKGWYVTTSPIITANWEASSGSVWTVPFGAGVGRIMKIGNQPVNIQTQFFGNAKYPTGGSPWTMRLQIALLFPKMSKQEEKMMLEKKLQQLDQQTPSAQKK
jgi:hypothetical protein